VRKIERELGRLAEEFGWSPPAQTNGGHYVFQHPEGGKIFFSSTPGDRKAIHRLKQKFRIANRETEDVGTRDTGDLEQQHAG
jgi:hypothetical protein